MAETLTLTTPIQRVDPIQTQWRIDHIILDIARLSITLYLRGENGEQLTVAYPTPAPDGSPQPSGQALLQALNTANLTNNSLLNRIFTRLIADGYMAGTVSGSL